MASTTNAVVATMAIVTVGKWANDEHITVNIAVGGAFLMVGLAAMENANADLAKKFATLVFVAAAFMYVPAIAYSAGLTQRRPPNWGGLTKQKIVKGHTFKRAT